MAQHGRFVWNELHTRDPEAAKRFYAATVGWMFEPMPMADGPVYWLAQSGSEMVGGIFDISAPTFDGVPEHWLGYVEMDEVDARAARVAAAGGAVLREPWSIAGVGRIALIRDPGGAVIGLMTSERQT